MLTTKQRAKLVGDKIKEARGVAGMSQVDLAVVLGARYGKEPETIRRSLVNNETGKYAPRLHMLQAIAEATGHPLEFFAVDGDASGAPFRAEAV